MYVSTVLSFLSGGITPNPKERWAAHVGSASGPVQQTMDGLNNNAEMRTNQVNPNDGHPAPWDDQAGYDLWEAERAIAQVKGIDLTRLTAMVDQHVAGRTA